MIIKLKKRNVLFCILCLITLFTIQASSMNTTEIKIVQNLPVGSTDNQLIVHFLDIGQADCILIQDYKGHTVLIDAGNETDSSYIQGYLMSLGIRKINILIATHPHEDHIGSMDDLVYTFDIDKIYAPKVEHKSTSNVDFMKAVTKKGNSITYATAGNRFDIGDAKFQILSPSKNKYDNLNSYSLVTKLNFGNVCFLFMGDAEGEVLSEIMNSGYNLESDVIKVGHHGSSVSMPEGFLNQVDPSVAVISVRKNSSKFPYSTTLSTLLNKSVRTELTASQGTIVVTTDGENIKVSRSIYKNTDKESLEK